ncbi:hypothetical protein [Chryseosolibacter indicus]|uniref:Uncharacterized protein n=1 Tax=Chryseosolibacter indicus TaxID=2782351 RepID=A0ABS5VTE2_9BACT|nr:hypothetical protein [Chryseosolibacter indicus]MBT1704695.1 hypothetical protein [Chryseosolibacter indicus]
MNDTVVIEAEAKTIICIGEKIINLHTNLGPKSPINNVMIADLNSKISIARQKHEEGEKYKKLMEDAWRERDLCLKKKEKGVIEMLRSIKNMLLGENRSISDWGF